MTAKQIYMDHHATTPVHPEVLKAMMPYFMDNFGNASSIAHIYGKVASEATEWARSKVAELINAEYTDEIVFTSGATESDNLAIKGIAGGNRNKGIHIITCTIEHKAVLESCKRLQHEGFTVTYLPVDKYGIVDPDDVKKALTKETILITIQYANSEIGTIQPIEQIGHIAKERGIIFHTDAVQAIGKIATDVQKLNVDLLSISAHKMYGPKGIGALYIKKNLSLTPINDGGGQEGGYRSGTLNVPGIVGFGKACEIARMDLCKEANRLLRLRESFSKGILGAVELAQLNGHPTRRLPNNLNFAFKYVDADALIHSTPEIAFSAGSACNSTSNEPSYVLLALGMARDLALCSVRFGLGRCNTEEQIDYVMRLIESNVNRLRSMSPLYEAVY